MAKLEVQQHCNFFCQNNLLKNVLVDTMEYNDSHSYTWRFIYCVKYLNIVFVHLITLLLHSQI